MRVWANSCLKELLPSISPQGPLLKETPGWLRQAATSRDTAVNPGE